MHDAFTELLRGAAPILALAPMHDVTDLPFWRLCHSYGGADLYFTEYIRVHNTSKPQRSILRAITENPTGQPVVAQIIGNDIPALVRTARELQDYPIVAIDLNLGCPAPIVWRKVAGGGLLRDPERIDAILGALRDAVRIKLSVKTRLGFDSPAVFERLLRLFAKHALDLVTVHGRTVAEQYQGPVHYDQIACAVRALPCPVLANGDIDSATNAQEVLKLTGAAGLMIGRAAIRNPWIFRQIRQCQRGQPTLTPKGCDLLAYIGALFEAVASPTMSETKQVQIVKRSMNYLGLGVDVDGRFLHQIQRTKSRAEFFRVCVEFLSHDRPMSLEPFAARRETAASPEARP